MPPPFPAPARPLLIRHCLSPSPRSAKERIPTLDNHKHNINAHQTQPPIKWWTQHEQHDDHITSNAHGNKIVFCQRLRAVASCPGAVRICSRTSVHAFVQVHAPRPQATAHIHRLTAQHATIRDIHAQCHMNRARRPQLTAVDCQRNSTQFLTPMMYICTTPRGNSLQSSREIKERHSVQEEA